MVSGLGHSSPWWGQVGSARPRAAPNVSLARRRGLRKDGTVLMTNATTTSVPAPRGRRRGALGWLRSKDPDLLVVKRSVRAAVVMPSVFAIAHVAFSDPQVSLFAAFGSFALLLLVEFTGPIRVRLASYLGLFVVGACFIGLGTIVSTHKVTAVLT